MRLFGRPFGILVLAVLGIAGGLWALAGVFDLHEVPELSIRSAEVPAELVRWLAGGWGVVLIVAAVLLLALHRWGWVLAMLATGLGLLVGLWTWFSGHPDTVRLALLVVSAFYLNGREIRELLLEPTARTGVVPLAAPEGGRR